MQPTLIGAPISRIEGPDKVAGRTHFAADINLPGMLWGKILRSPHPHARIRRMDASAAWSVPGVKAVVTGQDAPGHLMGKVLRAMPVLCWDRVRYIGDRLAAVAAETPEAAEEALWRIDVDYEVLPAVFDPMEAMRPEASLLHDDVASYAGAPLDVLARDVSAAGASAEDAIGRPLRVADVRQVLDTLEAGRWGKPKAGPGRGKGVATEMDVPLSWVRVPQGDTDSTPFDEGPRASRVTYTEGQAVLKACEHMRRALQDGATLPRTMTVAHDAPQPEDVMYFSAQVAEVDVDRKTGQVKVIKVVTAHEVGTMINPQTHQGQIDGGLVTGLGLAVTEELVSEDGQILHGHVGEYKLPTIADIPPSRPSWCIPAAARARIRRRPLGNGPTTPQPRPLPTPSVASSSRCLSQPRESTRLYTRSRPSENKRVMSGARR